MDHVLLNRLRRLCADIDSAFARRVDTLLVARDWDALATLEVRPQDYDDGSLQSVFSYKGDAALAGLFVKNKDLATSFNRRKASLDRWYESEQCCALTNARFSSYRSGYFPDVNWRIVQFLDRVQKRVASLLGPCPRHLIGAFGPGSTFESSIHLGQASRSLTTVDKIDALYGTSSALELSGYACVADRYLAPEAFGIQTSRRVVVRGSRWESVHKNAKTERSIGLEPGVNVYLQLGVARAFTAPLLRCGIDLSRGQERHRFLARNALSLGLATLDESMASDLWATMAVRFLLARSPEWLSLLESLRAPLMEVEGRWVYLEKFSSMGNGFTFPLQTLLFYAITREVVGEDGLVSVFGDDIICPANKAEEVMAALKFFGHRPNEDKSFYVGGFRESCGEDFFYGQPVRPHYLAEWPKDPPAWISFANGLRRRDSGHAFTKLRLWALRQIPTAYRLGGPERLGDAVIHGYRTVTRVVNWCKQVRGVQIVSRDVSVKYFDFSSLVTAAVYGISFKTHRERIGTLLIEETDEEVPVYVYHDAVPTRGTKGFRTKWYNVCE